MALTLRHIGCAYLLLMASMLRVPCCYAGPAGIAGKDVVTPAIVAAINATGRTRNELISDWFFWESIAAYRTDSPKITRCGIPSSKGGIKVDRSLFHSIFFGSYKDVFYEEAANYRLIKQLGKGKQGTVMLAEDQRTHELVAVKKASAKDLAREVVFSQLLEGYEDVVKMKHVLLPTNSHTFETGFVVLESLASELHEARALFATEHMPLEQERVMMYRVARGVHNLHRNHIFHLDLKVQNILVAHDCQPKIIDLGVAKYLVPGAQTEEYSAKHGCHAPEYELKSSSHLRSSLIDVSLVAAAEVWNLGCVFLHMAHGGDPFAHYRKASGVKYRSRLSLLADMLGQPSAEALEKFYDESAGDRITAGPVWAKSPKGSHAELHKIFPHVGMELMALLTKMLALDPEARPGMGEVMDSKIFHGLVDPLEAARQLRLDEHISRIIQSRLEARNEFSKDIIRKKAFYEVAVARAARAALGKEHDEMG